eukprot:TRINITY_DN8604_c0_g1_i1.p1 TRINITY_DN8604_c0_g1~~TRINITY_DN8604_c0_g1_i1.p1  ORF type:complete len:353 (+),score=76.19 TRINITY_DN8604_c0_g1_i1:100-1059(+)
MENAGPAASWFEPTADRKFLYAVTEKEDGQIGSFAIGDHYWFLKPLTRVRTGGVNPCHLTIHPSRKWLFAAHYVSGHFSVLPIAADSSISEPTTVLQVGKNAHQALVDRTGRFVFVACLGSDHIAQFVFDATTGTLQPNAMTTVALPTGSGPRHIVFHSTRHNFAYCVNELNSTVTVLQYNADMGQFAVLDTVASYADDAGDAEADSAADVQVKKENCPAEIAMSPCGRWVYVSNRGRDTIDTFAVSDVGLLRHVSSVDSGHWPRSFAVSADGQRGVVGAQRGNELRLFAVNTENGQWTLLQVLSHVVQPVYVMFAPQQ